MTEDQDQPGWNDSLHRITKQKISERDEEMFELETRLAYDRHARELMAVPAWAKLKKDMQEREKSILNQLISAADWTPQSFGRKQGYVRALRLLTTAEVLPPEEIAAIVARIKGLREMNEEDRQLLPT